MRRITPAAWAGLAFIVSQASWASTITQTVGAYSDNQGLTRHRVGYDVILDGGGGVANLTGSSYELAVTHDAYQRSDLTTDEYDREIYGSGYKTNDAVTASASQTWDRLTETRVLAAYATDQKVSSRTFSVGASQWQRSETVRLSVDVSRTLLEQPLYQILDYDSKEVGNPPIASSTGATVQLRHLATPTTIVDYSASHIVTANRPDTNTGTLAVRQFVPQLSAAFHATLTRAVNRGFITTETNYGQVDAWIVETAYLQNLWKGARSRLAYRYYKEDETTRAYGDETVFGSDTMSVGMAQDIPRRATGSLGIPLTIEAAAARYLTNVAVAANSFEASVTAKF